MHKVLNLMQVSRAVSDPATHLFSRHMLSELLFLHEEMVVQLCVERLEKTANAEFLTDMIAQHEATAALLRTELDHRFAHRPGESEIRPAAPDTFPPVSLPLQSTA